MNIPPMSAQEIELETLGFEAHLRATAQKAAQLPRGKRVAQMLQLLQARDMGNEWVGKLFAMEIRYSLTRIPFCQRVD